MFFSIDVKKLVRGTLLNYPSIEFSGRTIKNILEEVIGQNIAIIVDQGMEGSVTVCGNNEIEILFKSKGHKVMSAWAILSLWQDSPIIDIVWPPIPTLVSIAKASSPTEEKFTIPDFVIEQMKDSTPVKAANTQASTREEPSLFDAPVPADELFQQGYRDLSAGSLDAALDHFKQAVTLKPEFERAWSAFGFALEEACRDDDALSAYNHAVRLDPDKWETSLAMGRILVRKNLIKEGIKRLETAMILSKNDKNVIALLAKAYAQNGETMRAAELMAA